MAQRGYTLLEVPLDYHPAAYDQIVRCLEIVRLNMRTIIPNLPENCEFDLQAGGTAHNPGLMPLLLMYTPTPDDPAIPDLFDMYAMIERWVTDTTVERLIELSTQVDVPTWEQLCHDGMHPGRPAAANEAVEVSPNSQTLDVGDPNC